MVRKCRLLIESRANVDDPSSNIEGAPSILRWARERINAKFAKYDAKKAQVKDAVSQLAEFFGPLHQAVKDGTVNIDDVSSNK